jgi:hypothetical protein
VGYKKGCQDRAVARRPKGQWKPDMEAVKATICFLEKTGRLNYQPEVREAN